MLLLSLKLLLSLFLFFYFVRPIFAQEQYFFSDEFNIERLANTLDPDKWIVYPNKRTTPNSTGCIFDTINENAGFLKMKQCSQTALFPYVTSKNNPFPDGNFTATVKFKYVATGGQGSGIQFVDVAPENGAGYTSVFELGTWEVGSSGGVNQPKFYLLFQDSQVAEIPADQGNHEFKVEYQDGIYTLYLDNTLYYTSPPEQKKVAAVYFGDPSPQNPSGNWNQLWIDYIRIINNGLSQPPQQPFLDLPWNYETLGMSFTEAANSMNAYFDHEYPLLSSGILEPSQIIPYFKNTRIVEKYSSHDGYDYGYDAKTKLGTPQLAAATGSATFIGSCKPCGNAIHINHNNGFQTRYYHLQKTGLITDTEGTAVNVQKGQQIGLVGFSGNVDPAGEGGSHIHFMVIKDKNNDGDFEDNIPDGLVDPFGWQSKDPDPWENYSFFYKGQQRTGAKSYYLFTTPLDGLDETLTSNQKVFNIGKTTLEFPSNSVNQDVRITAKTEPNYTDQLLNSLGSILNIQAFTQNNQALTQFLENFTLKIDFSQFDLTRYNLNTLSIYSSQDGENWTKEETQINNEEKTASSSMNHLTHFALMAEPKDKIAPTTTANLQGQKGTGNNFRTDVSLSLNSLDNENGLGVEYTAWGYENVQWQTYTSPIPFTNEGNYKIFFYSQDKDDNIEEIKSVEFSIDKTPPEAKIEVDQSSWDLKISPLEATSSSLTKKPGKKLGETIYTITDTAGNTLTMETSGLDSKYIDLLSLKSLTYNSSPKIPLLDNLLDVNYIFYTPKKREEIKIINQNFFIKDKQSLRSDDLKVTFIIAADVIKNKTILNILENGTRRKEDLPGLRLLKLQTNQGKLEYSY